MKYKHMFTKNIKFIKKGRSKFFERNNYQIHIL